MSLRMLQKQVGAAPSEASAEAKAALQPGGNRSRPSGGGYYSSAGAQSTGSGGGSGGYYASQGSSAPGGSGGGGGGYYGGQASSAPASAAPPKSSGFVASPGVRGGFHGSDAQRAHVEAVRRSTADSAPVTMPAQDVAVRSHLGLNAIKERKQKEEEEKQAKREAARAKRRSEATQKEVADEQALAECEAQAWQDSEAVARVKYEAALVVRIALKFGSTSVWTKIAEARARGSDLPLDPRKIYLLAHPDKCPLPEAADATAILNAQRPPEMTEAKPRPAAKGVAKAAPPAAAPAAPAPMEPSEEAAVAEPEEEEGEERRIDPDDSQELTFEELREKYKSLWMAEDIQEYWEAECQPLKPARKTAKAKAPAPSAEPPPSSPSPEEPANQAQRKTRRF